MMMGIATLSAMMPSSISMSSTVNIAALKKRSLMRFLPIHLSEQLYKQTELPYLANYELSKGNASQKTEILFLERCFDFLKWETGKLAIILPDGILTNSSLQYVRDYIERHFQILAVVSLPQIAFSHYGAGVKTSILFLRKFSEQEYERYQAAINQIAEKNEAIYVPKIEELEGERRTLITKGSPAQVDTTETYRRQFIAILDDIDALNQKLDKTPTKKVQTLSAFFFPEEIESTPTREFELYDLQTARAELKAQTSQLNALEKEYKAAFKAAADPQWESQVKAEYKEKIDAVKEEWEDKNAEGIREWVRENANHPIFMAIAERIGYDATGRKDPINDLNTIYEEYQRFTKPDFFRVSPDRENQIFLTYRGEIINRRIDPYFHQPQYRDFHKKISVSNYPIGPIFQFDNRLEKRCGNQNILGERL